MLSVNEIIHQEKQGMKQINKINTKHLLLHFVTDNKLTISYATTSYNDPYEFKGNN